MKKISSSSSSKRNATSTGSETPKKKKNVKKRESNPSSSSSKRNDTPTGSKTPNKFTTDGDDEDELTFKMDWAMVESKIDGNRYFKAPPTNPEHRYVNKTIDTRDDKGVPVPVWWKMTQVLLTRKRMSDAPEDKRDSKLRDFYYQLATEGDDEETASQESATSELTLTPEVIEKKTSFLTETERKAAENKIMDAGPEGLQVEGLDCRVVYSLPTVSRTYGLFKLMFSGETGGGKFICAADSSNIFVNNYDLVENS
ncbi:hypothetical protein Fcan01_09795 [Folsomia candida]|uniref:Uncharacterized protein n=1 Tax=Folsomia candida TaxID=158441 RepID=A0A226EG22_FOLCA|nr:hypothetical protein Fcan01_09795 [Folsomia candida]